VLAAATVVLAVAAVVFSALLDAGGDPAHRAEIVTEPGWVTGLSGLALAIPGAILLRRDPRHPVAWVLCVAGVHWALDGAASSWLVHATAADPPLAGGSFAFWVYQRLGAALLLSLPLLLLLYPDGRLPTGPWRIASLVSLGATALLPVALLFAPSTQAQDAAIGGEVPAVYRGLDLDPMTIPLPDGVWSALLAVSYALIPLSLIVPFAVVVRRFRAARTRDDRTRMRWLLWAAVVDLMVMATVSVLPPAWVSAGLLVAVTVTGFAVTVGIVRPHLLDIDRLLGGTVLYGALALTVVLVDLAVVAVARQLLGERLGERDAALVAILVVLAVYGPVRHRLWLLVRRLVFGRRDDRYGVVAGLAEQLERSDSPEDQLLATARTVALAFRVPYVGVEVDRAGGRMLAEYGERPADTQPLPITYRDQEVGRLVLPTRRPRAALTGRDERLLADVVRQAAAAAHTAFLAEELQRSREEIVAAREEERRRLRRDLHDGLGPSLGAVGLRIETARNLARSSPDRADEVLRRAREDVATALADVRRLVHDLRPPALDDVGLLGAVRQRAEGLRAPGLAVRVDGGPGLEALPAAIEVAAYRIASEALANVARHAAASTCRVTLEVEDGALVVEIRDDGVGIPADTPAGVGLVSLRERAAELGGRSRVFCPNGRGTVVRAELPLGVRE
jgi:signal transduction histidine kinase